MDKIKIKIEPIKTEKQFIDFVDNNELEFDGMYLSGEAKTRTFWIKAYSEFPISNIITSSIESMGWGYILYSGEINGKYCVAAEIKS